MMKKTLVLGGSIKPGRFSNKAIRLLTAHGHPVVSIGLKPGQVEETLIETGFLDFQDVHTVTMYLGPQNQPPYYDYILGLHPKRVVFNPGTENAEFIRSLRAAGIEVVEHCTLVMLDSGIF
ncbi:MAG: CoA-binding protein [Bacteroidales bacterium]|nr:CoA-binding protein [Bacteroidales bacterium]